MGLCYCAYYFSLKSNLKLKRVEWGRSNCWRQNVGVYKERVEVGQIELFETERCS
jgi:hypothetical protein